MLLRPSRSTRSPTASWSGKPTGDRNRQDVSATMPIAGRSRTSAPTASISQPFTAVSNHE